MSFIKKKIVLEFYKFKLRHIKFPWTKIQTLVRILVIDQHVH